MGAVRERIPEKGTELIRAKGYVRLSTEHHPSSINRQKSAIRRYAKTGKLHIALICSDQFQHKPR